MPAAELAVLSIIDAPPLNLLLFYSLYADWHLCTVLAFALIPISVLRTPLPVVSRAARL